MSELQDVFSKLANVEWVEDDDVEKAREQIEQLELESAAYRYISLQWEWLAERGRAGDVSDLTKVQIQAARIAAGEEASENE